MWLGFLLALYQHHHADKGDKPKALEYLLKAKGIQLKKLGPNHPSTKDTQSWIDKVNNE